jgi:hypothetical protein
MEDIFQFLTKGRYTTENFSFLGNIRFIIIGYFKVLLFYILILILFSSLGLMNSNNSPSIKDESIPVYFKLLFICILMPILEELLFRFPLKPDKTTIIVSVVCGNLFLFFMTKKFFGDHKILMYSFYLAISIITVTFVSIRHIGILNFINNNFVISLHLLTISFCLIHYGNFNFKVGSVTPYLLMFLMLLNGYYFAYTRLRFGISYSILIHAFHNILISLPILIKLLK